MARKLRIAVSAFFGVLTLLLVVLWLRSYWWSDSIGNQKAGVWCAYGHAALSKSRSTDDLASQVTVESTPIHGGHVEVVEILCNSYGFCYRSDADSLFIIFPYWSIVLATGAFAIGSAPFTLHFSLRSLLIATTLLAVVLGLAVWAGR